MDVTGFVNDVIVGTAVFARDVLNTAYEFMRSPTEFAAAMAAQPTVPDGIVPPVVYLAVSVAVLSTATLGTLSLAAPETRKWRVLSYFTKSLTAFEWKRLVLLAVPFLAFVTLQAAFISLAADLLGYALPWRFALGASCYLGGTSYLIFSAVLIIALPQWAHDDERRFRPWWVWGPVSIALVSVGVFRNMFAFVTVLSTMTDGSYLHAYFVYFLGFVASIAVVGIAFAWISPLLNRYFNSPEPEQEDS